MRQRYLAGRPDDQDQERMSQKQAPLFEKAPPFENAPLLRMRPFLRKGALLRKPDLLIEIGTVLPKRNLTCII